MKSFLEKAYSNNLREVLENTTIFENKPEYKEQYNLVYAVLDRLDSCIMYLNEHAETPQSEHDILVFLMYSCMVIDASKQLLKSFNIDNLYQDKLNPKSYAFFRGVCMSTPLELNEDQCPTDDKFFEYFRALSFAHPFETSRPKFLMKNEIQYSPWVIANSALLHAFGHTDDIGVRVYSNKDDKIKDLYISFGKLKKYIKSRYEQIKLVTEKVKSIISNQEKEWKEIKVKMSLSPINTLINIQHILMMRYEDTYEIDLAIEFLDITLTNNKNIDAVTKYRNAICSIIPLISNDVDNMDYNSMVKHLDDVIYPKSKLYKEFGYQMEKMTRYFNDDQEYEWGKIQAMYFYEKFAIKWVAIDFEHMCKKEIRLLIKTACYLEYIEQNKI